MMVNPVVAAVLPEGRCRVGLVDHHAGLAQAAELDGARDGFDRDAVAFPLGREAPVVEAEVTWTQAGTRNTVRTLSR